MAAVVDKSEANCRQIFSRATRRLGESTPRFDPDPARTDALAGRFLAALEGEQVDELERLLAEDVVFYADGGGKAPAIKAPLEGAATVARFLLGLMRQGRRFEVRFHPGTVGGQPAYHLLGPDGSTLGLLALETAPDGRVAALRNQINPDKLAHLGPTGDLWALLTAADSAL